jgi:hypothetical protein
VSEFENEVGDIFDAARTERVAAENAARREDERRVQQKRNELDALGASVRPVFEAVKRALSARGVDATIAETSNSIAISVPQMPGSPRFQAQIRSDSHVHLGSTGSLAGRGDRTSAEMALDDLTAATVEDALKPWLQEVAKAWRG